MSELISGLGFTGAGPLADQIMAYKYASNCGKRIVDNESASINKGRAIFKIKEQYQKRTDENIAREQKRLANIDQNLAKQNLSKEQREAFQKDREAANQKIQQLQKYREVAGNEDKTVRAYVEDNVQHNKAVAGAYVPGNLLAPHIVGSWKDLFNNWEQDPYMDKSAKTGLTVSSGLQGQVSGYGGR